MERIPVSDNFFLDEFIDPYTYFNNEDNGISLIDNRLFSQVQLLRYHYMKPISINNWWSYYFKNKDKWSVDHIVSRIEKSKTINRWSGTRTKRSNIGSPISAHRIEVNGKCRAIDPKGNEYEFHKIIKNNAKVFYELGLRRLEKMEITPGWAHMDTLERNTIGKSIRVITQTGFSHSINF